MTKLLFAVLALYVGSAFGQNSFTLSGVIPEQAATAIDVNYTGTKPADMSPYLDSASWRVWVTAPSATKPVEVTVATVKDLIDSGIQLHKFRVVLAGSLPDNYVLSTWSVVFAPDAKYGVAGLGLTFAPPSPSNCDPTSPIHFFCVPASSATPDISLSGTFTAAGGTKPLYQFQLQGGFYLEKRLPAKLFKFRPGITTQTEINQSESTPVNRTTFDPNSITAGIALQRLKYLCSHPFDLYAVQFDETLPGGEFTRTDPTSNIMVSSSAQFILRAFTAPEHLTYGTLHPLVGIEAGHNLNKPSELDSVPVDLSHYNAIVRGVGGADASFARKSKDASVDVWSLTGSYRVRIPATDEPLIKTPHQVTSVELTTRARHWIEADLNVSPWSFKYLAITAKYQYGDLPPAFNFVDHSFSVGLTLKASQSNKPNAAGPPLAQPVTPNP